MSDDRPISPALFPSVSDERFPIVMAAVLVMVAVVGSAVMSWAGVDKGQIASIIVFTVGFAGMMVNQSRIGAVAARTAASVDRKVDKVATTLVQTNETRGEQMDRVESIGKSAQAVGLSTHGLVNGAHMAALQMIADLSDRIADLTEDPADRSSANTAATTLATHKSKIDQGGISPPAAIPQGQPIGVIYAPEKPAATLLKESPYDKRLGPDSLHAPEPTNAGPTDRHA